MMSNRGFLRLIVSTSCAAALMLCAVSLLVITPTFTRLIVKNNELEAIRVANHLIGNLTAEQGLTDQGLSVPEQFRSETARTVKDLGLAKIKLFDPDGKTIFSTAEADIGKMNTHDYFREVVAKGQVLTKVVKKENKSLEGQTYAVDVVETYVPMMQGGRFLGAFEIYLDITAEKEELSRRLIWLNGLMLTIAASLLTAMLVISWRARLHLAIQETAERKIIEQSRALMEKNGELSVINDVSRVLSTSIELETLLPTILKTVVERLSILRIAHKGGIFIVNGDRMELVTHLGHTEEFLKMHEGMTTADCLCGQAAKSGKVIISSNSHLDCQHTFRYPTMEPHGHIIVPLTSGVRVVGVLYLYLPEGLAVDDAYRDLLQSIGTQIGMAIDNARLYGETRKLSLHDPLTGIANRRFMDLNLQQALSLAERYHKPLVVAMFDIDFFKKYNDSHGHAAGDQLLAKVAGLISKGSRDSDMAARYGGEEFLLILPETDLAGGRVAAERIRKSIAEQCGVTISAGLAQHHPGGNQEQLVKAADAALYAAKEKGRNRVEAAE